MDKLMEILLAAVRDKDKYIREDKSIAANNLEKHALNYVNELQKDFRDIQLNINLMKAELGKAGFEVEFERVSNSVRVCDSGEKILKADGSNIHHIAIPAFHAGGFLSEPNNNITICKISKKNSDDVIIKTKAEVADDDLNIELLGEYLSLARATRIVLGDYNA